MRGNDFQDIASYSNKDSITWKHIVKHKDTILGLMSFSREYQLTWNGIGNGDNIKISYSEPTPLEAMILWLKGAGPENLLWRLRWDFLVSFKMFRQWGLQSPLLYLLCGEEESIGHLFFNCCYSRKNFIDVSAATGHALWKQLNSHIPGLGVDIRAGGPHRWNSELQEEV